MSSRILFLTLNTFSSTGGIEKVCRAAGKAFYELAKESNEPVAVFSMYDKDRDIDERYFSSSVFKGFGGQKIQFIRKAIQVGRRSDFVLLSHINLLLVGFLVKLLSPKTKLILIAHGIEVWEKLPALKQRMLKAVDIFLPVSKYTAQKLQAVHRIASGKIRVLNNCLDPFLKNETNPFLENALRKRYGIGEDDFVLLTVTRLKFSEQYKGYDKVVEALKTIRQTHTNIKYLIVGKYDEEEKARLDVIIQANNMQDAVIFAGFAKEEELNAHFNIADTYIMPSTGEGFGIVFIEALFHGLTAIAGNVDGSVDALAGGEFGLLVNPYNTAEIVASIEKVLADVKPVKPKVQTVMETFGFTSYKRQWQKLLYPEEKVDVKRKTKTVLTN